MLNKLVQYRKRILNDLPKEESLLLSAKVSLLESQEDCSVVKRLVSQV